MKKYQIIYADPPWQGAVYFRSSSSAYPLMPTTQICNLPVRNLTHPDSFLFLWTTMNRIPHALRVIEAWGFCYITNGFTWVKTNTKSGSFVVGLGAWTRHNAELCLLAKKGHPKRQSAAVKSLVVAPRQRHSQKPNIIRKRIVELCGDLPRIELFARQKEPGWDCWGNELTNDIDLSISGNPQSLSEGNGQ